MIGHRNLDLNYKSKFLLQLNGSFLDMKYIFDISLFQSPLFLNFDKQRTFKDIQAERYRQTPDVAMCKNILIRLLHC